MNAAALIESLPARLKPGAGQDIDICYHFRISGDGGGDFTVRVRLGQCTVESGLTGDPKCVVDAAASDYEDVEMGRTNPQLAVLFGRIKVSNIASMLKFTEMFEKAR